MRPEPKSAFVTGGTGFIGSHLVEALLRDGYGEVRCLVRGDLKWLDGLDIVPVRGDLASEKALRQGVRGVDYVYHVAGVTRAREPSAFERGNVQATLNLLRLVEEESPNVKKVLVTSSLAAVGICDDGVADETTPLNPLSGYGRSKAAMEQALTTATDEEPAFQERLPLVIIRPPAVYGPREADIFTFFKAVSRGLCPIVGRGLEKELSLVYVGDLVRGMVQAAASAATVGRTYFLGSDAFYSWREVRDATAAALGRKVLTLPVPPALIGLIGAATEIGGRLLGTYPPLNREKARELLKACKRCTIDRARRDFGYQPQVSLEEGLHDTITWYKTEGWL